MREDIKPTLFISREGVPLDFWFLDYSFTDAYRKKYFNGVSDLMGYFLVEKKRIERDIEERIRRNKEIEDRRSYLLKKREKLRETISREGEIRRLELIGEMIFANLSSIPDKASRIKLSNPYTGELEDVELDPSLTPALNAQRYFKEAAKLRRGIEKAKYELNKVEEELAKLSAVNISPLPDREGMEKREEKSEKRDGKAFREFEYKGWVILVGKGASSNEELTFRISSDDDIWLHVKGSPGSHVVIRNPLKQEVPLDVLEFAASLAAYYSKAKMNTKVPVDYTLVKYVKRHPAGKRGAVLISNQRTIWVRPRSGEIF
ncbi:MAG: DUF814 domain-containing protein [Synergistetes bacterium]|nr:DUF814 domain-containing protein [Synergistota bacterium]